MKFSQLFPHLRPWVLNLVNIWPAYYVKPNFAIWEVFHILSLVILGGSAILIGLRLIGVGLTEEKPSEIYRNLRVWLNTGVIGVVITGVLIGMANAERLYDSPAFLVKMIALLAGLILVYGATRPIALAEGEASGGAKLATAAALLIWLLGIVVFLTGGLITPGLFHVITAAALIVLFVVRGRVRWVYLGGVGVILLAMYIATHVIIQRDDLAKSDPANVALAWVMALWIFGAAAWQVFAARKDPGVARLIPKIVGYATILIWVSAAAAGRWIAFA
jgi:hypothetical protein